MTKDHKLILVGVISSAHGIKGDIIVESYTDPIDNIANLKLFDDKNVIFPIKKIRATPKGSIICRHSNCHDRNQAEALIGTKLYCTRESLPKTDKEEFYFEDLKNLQVLNKITYYTTTEVRFIIKLLPHTYFCVLNSGCFEELLKILDVSSILCFHFL